MEVFITSVKSQLEIFVNRIKSNLSRGRTVINGGSLETFYSKITPMHQKLLQYIQQQDEKRCKYWKRLFTQVNVDVLLLFNVAIVIVDK